MATMKFSNNLISAIVISTAFFCLPGFIFAATPTYESAPTASEVLIVYNSNYTTDSNSSGTQDSREIAEYYQTKRSIPALNVTGIPTQTTEVITRTQYNAEIKPAIESYLTDNGLTNSIKYIVLTKGIPLKIQSTNGGSYGATNYSSVDAAVCLLYEDYDIIWRYSNPYYNSDPNYTKAYHFKTNHFSGGLNMANFETFPGAIRYLVTRLDGYTVADIKTMIDKAADPDTSGTGYWIIDDHLKSYDHMSTAYTNLKNLSQNVNPDPWSDTTSAIVTNAAGSVMGYTSHGVHAGMADGYVTDTLGFTYLNGAVFTTYESFNGYGFVADTQSSHGQVAEFIESGGTGGIGNVYEPWASGCAHEEIFMPAYAAGYNFADAVYQSLAYMDFVTVVVGDPLMTIREITSPGEVSSLSAVAGDNQVSLTWTNPVDADFAGVKILRKIGSYPGHSADGTLIYNSNGTSYTDTTCSNGTAYYYAAFAYDEVPNYSPGSDAGARATATPTAPADETPPGDVSEMSAVVGLGQIFLIWTNPGDSDFVGVKILRKTTGYPSNQTDGTLVYNGADSSFIDSDVNPDNTYYYTAFAYDEVPNYSASVAGAQASASSAESDVSEPDTELPDKPGSFNAAAGDTQIELTWTNPSNLDFTGIKVLQRTDYYPISATNGTIVYAGDGTSYINTGLTNGTTYFYTIFSFDKVNNYSIVDVNVQARATPYSGAPIDNASAGDPPSTAFTEPDISVVSDVADMSATIFSGEIALTWTDPFNDIDWMGTKLVRKTGSYPASAGDGTVVYNGQASTYTDTDVSPGTTYYYAGFAYDDSRNYSDGTASGAKTSALAQ